MQSHSYVCPLCGPMTTQITTPVTAEDGDNDQPSADVAAQVSQLKMAASSAATVVETPKPAPAGSFPSSSLLVSSSSPPDSSKSTATRTTTTPTSTTSNHPDGTDMSSRLQSTTTIHTPNVKSAAHSNSQTQAMDLDVVSSISTIPQLPPLHLPVANDDSVAMTPVNMTASAGMEAASAQLAPPPAAASVASAASAVEDDTGDNDTNSDDTSDDERKDNTNELDFGPRKIFSQAGFKKAIKDGIFGNTFNGVDFPDNGIDTPQSVRRIRRRIRAARGQYDVQQSLVDVEDDEAVDKELSRRPLPRQPIDPSLNAVHLEQSINEQMQQRLHQMRAARQQQQEPYYMEDTIDAVLVLAMVVIGAVIVALFLVRYAESLK